jgi:hypothetical protein
MKRLGKSKKEKCYLFWPLWSKSLQSIRDSHSIEPESLVALGVLIYFSPESSKKHGSSELCRYIVRDSLTCCCHHRIQTVGLPPDANKEAVAYDLCVGSKQTLFARREFGFFGQTELNHATGLRHVCA